MSATVILVLLSCNVLLNSVKSVDIEDIKMDEYNDYVLLASDVQEYFKARSVFIIYAGNDESIRSTTLMKSLIRKFSAKSILSFVQNFSNVIKYRDYYLGRIKRPLYVVFLSCHKEVEMFQKVTQNYDMSYPTWLLIFTEPVDGWCSNPAKNYLNVAFDTVMLVKCYRDATIREWYSLSDKLIVKDLAVWHVGKRLELKTNNTLYERRHSLEGKVLDIAVVKESIFVEGKTGPMGGLFGTIMTGLSESLNFTVNIKYKEASYGIYDRANKSWSGVIGRLANKQVDVGVAEFAMSKERLDAVDFTMPIMLSRSQLYLRQPDYSALQWFGYFKVYTSEVWLMLVLILILASFLIVIICWVNKDDGLPHNSISEIGLNVLGILCQQGVPDFAESSPTRIAYFSILLKSVIFQAIYSACLISYLTLTTPSLPFNNFKEFVKDGSYKLITCQQSHDYNLFATSTDKLLMKMMKQMKAPKDLPKSMVAGFKQACDRKVAFYATEAVKSQISDRIPCNLVFIQSGRIDSLGLTLTKKSQFTGVINHHLQRFKDVGIMDRLKTQVYMKVLSSKNRYNPVGLNGVVTILLILASGMLISFAILAIEVLAHRARILNECRGSICSNFATTKRSTIAYVN